MDERTERIHSALNAGTRIVDLVREFGVSHYRIRQIVDSIPEEELHIPCHLCKQEMDLAWGLKHHYHGECAAAIRYHRSRSPYHQTKLTDRNNTIADLLSTGMRAIDIAQSLALSRERVRQIIYDDLDWNTLHIPCDWCGEEMEARWGLAHKCHEECREVAEADRSQKYFKRYYSWRLHQPRDHPIGEFEQVALTEYQRQDYDCLWMPAQASFDYVVNGYKVDVKGSSVGNYNGRWVWPLAAVRVFQYRREYGREYPYPTDMSARCDIIHLVGKNKKDYKHFIIPANEVGCLTCISITPDSTRKQKWGEFEDDWWRLADQEKKFFLTI